jgi:hypothetical protein
LTSRADGSWDDAIEPVAQHSRMTTMSRFRLTGVAGLMVVTALVGGTIISSVAASTASRATPPAPALAAPSAAAPAAGARGAAYCADFRKAFAADLGVDESALVPAARKAALSTIDAAVADGTMTKTAADRLKARIEAADANACALLAGRIGAGRAGAGAGGGAVLGVARDGLAAAAEALGMTPAELGARLRGGSTLKDVATAKGVPYATVSAAVVASVKTDLDAAVRAGKIPQAREDRVLERLSKNLADGRLRNAKPAAPTGPAAPATGG